MEPLSDPEFEPDFPELPRLEAYGEGILFLIDASSPFEAQILRRWIKGATRDWTDTESPIEVQPLPPSRRPRRRAHIDPSLEARLAADDDPILTPLRVAWLPKERKGVRMARLVDLLRGDPRDPGRLRQFWTYHRHPDRFRVLAGEPATLSELRERWHERSRGADPDTLGFAAYVARQAALTLERAERQLRGARYKVPRFVAESILSSPGFQKGIPELARKQNLPPQRVRKAAAGYLREIAATHSSFVIDLVAQIIRILYRQGYGERLQYDATGLREVARLAQTHPVVFLPSHKSTLDHLVLQYALYENGLPPNHTAGGINMNFFPAGPLLRRAGTFFMRRSFKDNETYKFVLRRYIDYLIEKRFSLEWYIEGGRSRSGKLLFPRFGLLTYVVDSFLRGKSNDVILVPVSIAYDQILDVGDYITEEGGGKSEREGIGWMVRNIRKLQQRRGNIHIHFGRLISLREAMHEFHAAPAEARDVRHESVQARIRETAFEVGLRINQATPITPISLVALAMLCSGNRALSIDEVRESLTGLLEYVERRNLPTTGALCLESDASVKIALDTLVRSDVLSCYAEGATAVYQIGPDQHLAAAYYRNSIIHFFVNTAIIEVALLSTAEREHGMPLDCFWREVSRLRALLHFDFFFEKEEVFRRQIEAELDGHEPLWRRHLSGDRPIDRRNPIRQLIRSIRPLTSPHVLRPVFEAYRVVGDQLEQLDPSKPFDRAAFLSGSLALGKQYLLQQRILNPDSRSKAFYTAGLRLAEKRELLEGHPEDLADQRAAFAAEIRSILRHIEAISALTAMRHAGFDN